MNVANQYKKQQAWGISAAIDLRSCDSKIIRDAEKIKQFVVELCDLIEVKRFGECIVIHFGEREEIAGFSMTQLIETSLVSGHFVNSTNNVYLDVFSCKYFDPDVVAKKSSGFFKAKSFSVNYLLRK